ncbi:PadR family transcriptional regulator [Oribacterium sp. HCP28S3_H8]|uniref:PadR family transcriptional regulator n=1 Tax=Oribacterium sp. HCP28S3_H8 TaxID=3438945 RepID=UPI003F8A5D01
MRTLKYALLGLINRQSMSGYDITREFNNNKLANFWHAKHSQVYPELNRLTEEGLITCELVNLTDKFEKKMYTITDAGKKEFAAWLSEDEPLAPTPKDVFRLRMYFCENMTPQELSQHLDNAVLQHEKSLAKLMHIMSDTYGNVPPEICTQAYGDYMVLEGAILREESYLEWLHKCLDRM